MDTNAEGADANNQSGSNQNDNNPLSSIVNGGMYPYLTVYRCCVSPIKYTQNFQTYFYQLDT